MRELEPRSAEPAMADIPTVLPGHHAVLQLGVLWRIGAAGSTAQGSRPPYLILEGAPGSCLGNNTDFGPAVTPDCTLFPDLQHLIPS